MQCGTFVDRARARLAPPDKGQSLRQLTVGSSTRRLIQLGYRLFHRRPFQLHALLAV